jgi:hypothetical protein
MIIPFHYIIRSIFYSVFCSVPRISKHPEVCVYIQNFLPVFLPFRRLSGENNNCNFLILARSYISESTLSLSSDGTRGAAPLTIGMKHIRQHLAQRKVVWVNKIVVTTIKFAESCL